MNAPDPLLIEHIELSELDMAVMAARMSMDTVREQQEEIRRLRSALAGEVGLVKLVASRPELRFARDTILSNHRHIEALTALGDSDV